MPTEGEREAEERTGACRHNGEHHKLADGDLEVGARQVAGECHGEAARRSRLSERRVWGAPRPPSAKERAQPTLRSGGGSRLAKIDHLIEVPQCVVRVAIHEALQADE